MQKVLRNAQLAKRSAQRRNIKAKEHQEAGRKWQRRQQEIRLVRTTNDHIRDAKRNRRVDWETGALAPRRDVGEKAEKYATLELYDMNLPIREKSRRPDWWHVVAGDRVVVVNGREKGRIGVVDKIDEQRCSVQVNDINVVDFYVPDWVQREDADTRKVVPFPQHLPIEDVRLVYPLPDPETGKPKDVVIDRLQRVNRERDLDTGKFNDGDRCIPGTRTIIPWPEKPDPDSETHADDTLNSDVEEETFYPVPLMNTPMPASVIDELRNKYGKYRTRHDWDFERKIEAKDEAEEKRKAVPRILKTPLEELKDLRERRNELTKKELSAEQLVRIGEVMAGERERVKGLGR